MSRVGIFGVPSKDAAQWWPIVSQWVASALDYSDGFMDEDDVLNSVLAMDFQLWVILNDDEPVAAVVTCISVRPKGRALVVVACGGHGMDIWLRDLVALLRSYGRENGCRSVQAHGRRGWVRALKRFEWREQFVTVSMEV